MYVIFRYIRNTSRILDFTNVVSIEYKDGYYVLRCLDKTIRHVNADEYKIICVELED